jgi:transcriptional regulator with XRE-family HTH domain
MITSAQIRMAKAALGWSNTKLAEETGLHKNTVNNAENGKGRPATLALIEKVLTEAGVVFVEPNGLGPGVRLKDPTK